jgi:hypothetical protein
MEVEKAAKEMMQRKGREGKETGAMEVEKAAEEERIVEE